MSRKPVFFARTPRLVSQVSAQRTMPSASMPAGDGVLDPVAAVPRPRAGEVEAGGRADERRPGRRPEGLVGAGVTPQQQARDVDDREDAQQQQRGGAGQRGDHRGVREEGHHHDQREREEGRERDPGVRRAPARQHLAERPREHVLLGEPVEQAAGHQHVDQRGVGDRDHGQEGEDPVDREPGRTHRDHGQQDLAVLADDGLDLALGDHRDHRDRDQHVEDDGDAQPGEHDLGEDLHRVLGLLDHVDRVLEARPSRRTRSRWRP